MVKGNNSPEGGYDQRLWSNLVPQVPQKGNKNEMKRESQIKQKNKIAN